MEISERERFVVYIDQIRVEDNGVRELLISGWAGNSRLETFSSIQLETDEGRVPLRTGFVREDVARRFGSTAPYAPGYAGRVYIPNGALYFRLIGLGSGGETRLYTGRIPDPSPIPDDGRGANSYSHWLKHREPSLFWNHTEIAARLAGLAKQPLISVIVPTFNTDPYHLYRCVHSLLCQHYQNWQLCIADDGSRDPVTLRMLAEFSALDSRIRVRLNEKNGGISAASMSAAEMAEGEFLLLLDHDDELHRHALAEVARQINLTPDAALIYSDEDKINEMGERSYPTFKPGFDPDMLLAYCYTGHILCVRADVFRAVGGLRSDFDGAQDWDLLIRIAEAIGPSRIQHIPKPLYHWRMHPESTSMNLDSKPFSQAAWQRVLEDCLERRGLSAKVEKGLFLGSMRIRYSIPDGTRTAVILRMDDGSRQLAMAGRARMNEGIRFFESFFSTVHDLETQRIVLSTEDLDADIAVFINVPVDRLNHFFYEELISQCSRPGCGMAGGVLLDLHGRIVSSGLEASTGGAVLNAPEGMPLISLGYMGRLRVVHAAPAVSPHFFAVRGSVLASAGGMARLNGDSGHGLSYALAAECRKMGLKVIFTPFAIATAAAAPESAPRWNEAFAVPSELALNSNLSAFPDVVGALRNGI